MNGSRVKYVTALLAVCEQARSLPFPPTGDGAAVDGWTNSEGSVDEVELTVLAGAAVTVSNAVLVVEEVMDTYPEESNAVTADNATEKFTYVAHGFYTGDGPVRFSGTLPAEIDDRTEYYVIRTAANDFKIATSRADALAGTDLEFTTDGADVFVHWVTGTKSTSQDASGVTFAGATDYFTFAAPHGVETGTRVQVANTGGGLPTGLLANTDYFAIAVSATQVAFATTAQNAANDVRIALADAGTGTQSLISDNRGATEETVYTVVDAINGGDPFDLDEVTNLGDRFPHRPSAVAYHIACDTDDFVPITAYVRGLSSIT